MKKLKFFILIIYLVGVQFDHNLVMGSQGIKVE